MLCGKSNVIYLLKELVWMMQKYSVILYLVHDCHEEIKIKDVKPAGEE